MSISRHPVSLGVAGFVLAILMYVGMVSGPVSGASASGKAFCSNVNLPPYGSYGDRCYAWEWEAEPLLIFVGISTQERAGCVSYAPANSYDIKDSWYCISKENYGYRIVTRNPAPTRGVIRNNNLSYSGRFTGQMTCCYAP